MNLKIGFTWCLFIRFGLACCCGKDNENETSIKDREFHNQISYKSVLLHYEQMIVARFEINREVKLTIFMNTSCINIISHYII